MIVIQFAIWWYPNLRKYVKFWTRVFANILRSLGQEPVAICDQAIQNCGKVGQFLYICRKILQFFQAKLSIVRKSENLFRGWGTLILRKGAKASPNSGQNLRAKAPLRSGDGQVFSVDFARNNLWVVSGTESGTLCVWNVETTRASHQRLNGHSGVENCVAFSLDSCRLASASEDKTVSIWNPQTGEQLMILSGHTAGVNGAAISADGILVGSSSNDETIRLWDLTTGQTVNDGLQCAAKDKVDFSPDGIMVTGSISEQVVICQRDTGKLIAVLECVADVHSVRFSPDGRSLVAAHD